MVSVQDRKRYERVIQNIFINDENAIDCIYASKFNKSQKRNNAQFIVVVDNQMRESFKNNMSREEYAEAKAKFQILKLYEWKENQYERVNHVDQKVLACMKGTYEKCYHLFDNYTMDDTIAEENTKEEASEAKKFLNAVMKTKVMTIARSYINHSRKHRGKNQLSQKAFMKTVAKAWFGQFDTRYAKSVSGFEHTFIGEKSQGKLKGYHFWLKYLIDDSKSNHDGEDQIDFDYQADKGNNPHYIAIKFLRDDDTNDDLNESDGEIDDFSENEELDGNAWTDDEEEEENDVEDRFQSDPEPKLSKGISSFMVGSSPEATMALGMVLMEIARQSNAHRSHNNNGVSAKVFGDVFQFFCFVGGRGRQNIKTVYPQLFS